jgi:hypothetical protein
VSDPSHLGGSTKWSPTVPADAGTCGHRTRTFDGAPLVCQLAKGHKGLHEQRVKLRDGVTKTNWQENGRSIWAK